MNDLPSALIDLFPPRKRHEHGRERLVDLAISVLIVMILALTVTFLLPGPAATL